MRTANIVAAAAMLAGAIAPTAASAEVRPAPAKIGAVPTTVAQTPVTKVARAKATQGSESSLFGGALVPVLIGTAVFVTVVVVIATNNGPSSPR